MTDQSHGAVAGEGSNSKSRPYLIGAMVLVFLLVLGFLGYRWASKGGLATLVDLEGTPERDYSSQLEKWITAEQGDEFNGGDGARTSESEVAHFRLKGGARLELKPSSRIRFQTSVDENTLGVSVELGEVDVRTSNGSLRIDSEFGPIQIHENSRLALKRRDGQLEVGVELGSIELGKGGRTIKAGETVEVDLGGIVLDREAVAPKEPEEEAKEEEPELEKGDGVDTADLVVSAGETFTIHDPRPPTHVGIDVSKVCGGKPARLSAGKQKTEALKVARLRFSPGQHKYFVRCLDEPNQVAASGNLAILQDAGTRNLPNFAPSANVSTDGRRYTVLYQHRLPQVHVSWPNAPQASSYTLQMGGRTITTKSPNHTFKSVPRGTHQVIFSAASTPPRKSRMTTISVVYDSQAPAARVAMPPAGYEAGSTVDVEGQALPGWTVSVAGKELEVDSQRRFKAEVRPDASLPITFSHPSYGTHYYLRRSKSSSP